MEQDEKLRISLVQYDIAWENKQKNLDYIQKVISALSGKTDIIVLPEMCTTGFSMNSRNLAEPDNGNTITSLKQWSKQYNVAICGSYIAEDNGNYYNRGFFITPADEHYYDKRHLFRMGGEPQYFSAGSEKIIFTYKGFNICLLICYDLRFPVWARNVDNAYDLLIYVANWPASRAKVWNTLLIARALENMSYVCGVNRIGTDGNNLDHEGGSKLINAKGDEISAIPLNQEQVETVCISKIELEHFRAKFPVWKDADRFEII
ncbi:omega-amidase [Dysgonomonas sp. PFB1-18]|uniref:amidohydrolase n=1 Tax=unclassified Dysgonomonas TaxID=2630389 RepID=UPI00247553E9|nr:MULTISPECIES: amidohydrolase [unclassified Dysgonomonas]MDH6307681.1 omega-amidase [Dysgonomonas sp. PF1-14]MDH6337599.1 omega-amidase [Dysgonomonas sp. PF1-16]MDH6378823.1 omega-amidase [Dysgonomonas sp. PFB1-18]MDH6396458.1 omega-amidase [Dysgonomonas sp. PF1-23]